MGMTFNAISAAGGASGGSVSDSWEAIGGNPTSIVVSASGTMGSHYTVPSGKRFVGYIVNNNGSVSINGVSISNTFWYYGQYYNNKTLQRLNAGDVVSTTQNSHAYIKIVGTESTI